jgi:hypothetical protein
MQLQSTPEVFLQWNVNSSSFNVFCSVEVMLPDVWIGLGLSSSAETPTMIGSEAVIGSASFNPKLLTLAGRSADLFTDSSNQLMLSNTSIVSLMDRTIMSFTLTEVANNSFKLFDNFFGLIWAHGISSSVPAYHSSYRGQIPNFVFQSSVNIDSSSLSCASHFDCPNNDYCDYSGSCYPCCACPLWNDPIDNVCPSCSLNCSSFSSFDTSISSALPCSSNEACNIISGTVSTYCATDGNCYICEEVITDSSFVFYTFFISFFGEFCFQCWTFLDAFDGNCVECQTSNVASVNTSFVTIASHSHSRSTSTASSSSANTSFDYPEILTPFVPTSESTNTLNHTIPYITTTSNTTSDSAPQISNSSSEPDEAQIASNPSWVVNCACILSLLVVTNLDSNEKL